MHWETAADDLKLCSAQAKKKDLPAWEMSKWCNDIQHIQKGDSSYFVVYLTAAHPCCELTKVLICIRFWNGAGKQHQTLLSRRTELFQAVDPDNPEHISSATMVQWQDEEDSLCQSL